MVCLQHLLVSSFPRVIYGRCAKRFWRRKTKALYFNKAKISKYGFESGRSKLRASDTLIKPFKNNTIEVGYEKKELLAGQMASCSVEKGYASSLLPNLVRAPQFFYAVLAFFI